MPKGKRLTKRELRRDPVKESLVKAFDWSKKNSDKVLWGISGFLILLVAFGVFFGTRNRSSPENELRFLTALASYSQKDTTRFVSIMQELMSRSSNSPEGKRALYYLAQYRLEQGDLESAEAYINQYLKQKMGDPFLDAGAYATLGSIALERGNPKESAKYYLEAEKSVPYASFKVFYLYRAARSYMEANDLPKALEILERLMREYPDNSIVKEMVKNEIPLLKGAIQGTHLAPEEGSVSESS